MFRGIIFAPLLLLAACGAGSEYKIDIGWNETYTIVKDGQTIVPSGIVYSYIDEPYYYGLIFPVEAWTCAGNKDRPRRVIIDEENFYILDTSTGKVDYYNARKAFEAALSTRGVARDIDYSQFDSYRPMAKNNLKFIERAEDCTVVRFMEEGLRPK